MVKLLKGNGWYFDNPHRRFIVSVAIYSTALSAVSLVISALTIRYMI